MAENTNAIVQVKDMEKKLAAARESARAMFIQQAEDAIGCLKSIGFEYELVEKNGAQPHRLGRPRKDKGVQTDKPDV